MNLRITVEQLRALGMPEEGVYLCARWAAEQADTTKETRMYETEGPEDPRSMPRRHEGPAPSLADRLEHAERVGNEAHDRINALENQLREALRLIGNLAAYTGARL